MIDYKNMPDVDLCEMCQQGDEGAWQYLYNYIFVICRNRRWNLNDPEDMASKTTMKLLDNVINKVKDKNKFKNFVAIITINLIKDGFKKGKAKIANSQKDNKLPVKAKTVKVELPIEDIIRKDNSDSAHDGLFGEDANQLENMINYERAIILEAGINKLPPRERKIFKEWWKYKQGEYKNYNELNKHLGIDNSTITRNVEKSMKMLISMPELKELY